MSQAKGEGKVTTYQSVISPFKDFCQEKGYAYPKISKKAVLHYIIQQNKEGATFATLNQINPLTVYAGGAAAWGKMECFHGDGGCVVIECVTFSGKRKKG